MLTNLFPDRHEPLFLNEGSFHSELVLQKMEALRSVVDMQDAERLDRDIALLRAGVTGEKRVAFELRNAHYPIVFLHDLNLEHDGTSAQVDFLVISPYNAFVLECKNLVGNIEIQADGTFVRTFGGGNRRRREAIYSPVTQNTRHVELMKAILRSENGRVLSRLLGGLLESYIHSVVVLANDRAVLDMTAAPKDVCSQIVRCDQLVSHIKRIDKASRKFVEAESFDQMMRNAQGWLRRSRPLQVNLAERYAIAHTSDAPKDGEPRNRGETKGVPRQTPAPTRAPTPIPVPVPVPAPVPIPVPAPVPAASAKVFTPPAPTGSQPQGGAPLCPVCGSPMRLRTARRGPHKGEQFWGCSTFGTTRCPGIVRVEHPGLE